MEVRFIRAPRVSVVDRGGATTVIATDGVVRRFEGDSAALLRAVLEIHARPMTRSALFATLAERVGGEVPVAPVEALCALLVQAGVLVAERARVTRGRPRRVVLGVTGAVAAVDAPAVVRALQAAGCDVRVALTRAARRFVSAEALTALTHHRAHRGLWDRHVGCPVPHVNLAEWAELVLVCPATATTIGRLANGSGVDLVSAIVLATAAPVVVVPSMNAAMYGAPAVQRNLETLRGDGRWLVHPAFGVEVAHAPAARSLGLGPAPGAQVVVEIVGHVLATISPPPPVLPVGDDAWDEVWARPPGELPWWGSEIDSDVAAFLDALPAATLVDLGCGAGVTAIAAAKRGWQVVATEISGRALGLARRRAGELPVTWILDDVSKSVLRATFSVAHDRGVLHCLPPAAWSGYAATVTRLVAPGGLLLVKAHTAEAAVAQGTAFLGEEQQTALFAPAFALEQATPSAIGAARATLYVWRRALTS